MEYIRDSFQSKEEFHQYSSEKTYLAVIRVTHNGTYIEDSLDFPYVSYLIEKMNDLHRNELYTNLAERYETIKKELHKLFNQKFQNTPVGHEEINEMTSVLSKYLNWPEVIFGSKHEGYIFDSAYEKVTTTDPPFLNSFYLKDLHKIIEKNVLSSPLSLYLNGINKEERDDLHENR